MTHPNYPQQTAEGTLKLPVYILSILVWRLWAYHTLNKHLPAWVIRLLHVETKRRLVFCPLSFLYSVFLGKKRGNWPSCGWPVLIMTLLMITFRTPCKTILMLYLIISHNISKDVKIYNIQIIFLPLFNRWTVIIMSHLLFLLIFYTKS